MTLQEAIEARHSVRAYKDQPLADDVVKVLSERVSDINRDGRLHIQLILNEKKAFQGTIAKYGRFRNVSSYFVMAGKKADDLDELVGYYGEQLVLLAQTLGLNTCWGTSHTPRFPVLMSLRQMKRYPVTYRLAMARLRALGTRSRP